MKIVLFAPPIMDVVHGKLVPIAMDAHRECPPYGMYLLKAILVEHGHSVLFADLIAEGTCSINKHLEDVDEAQLIGIGATSMSWPTALQVISQIRQRSADVPIVLGGIHPTMFDRYILSIFPVQFIVRGEGEIGITELAEAIETNSGLAKVSNLSWVNKDGTIIRNEIKSLIKKEAFSQFPLPDYSQISKGVYQSLSIESSRGCAFDCSFCSTSYRRTWRGMDPEEFVDRLEAIMPYCDRTIAGHIHIIDDEFSMNVKRATKISEIIAQRNIKPGLVFDSRANDLLDERYVNSIASFTTQFLVGAECGYDEGLKLIGKGTTCEKLENAASILAKYGIASKADFSFVLGLPWEGRAEVERTVSFAAHLHGSYGVRILLQWYCQIPGSRIWNQAYREGLVSEAMYDEFGFFGNYYLFRSAIKLTTEDIYKVSDKIAALLTVVRTRYGDKKMIEYAFPEPVAKYFPRILQSFNDTGLLSLRQVASPGSKAASKLYHNPRKDSSSRLRKGIPLRHFDNIY